MVSVRLARDLESLKLDLYWRVKHGWWSILATVLVSYAFIGVEEIGVEIEDPFGDDPNDLPLDKICTTIEQNLTELNHLAEVTGSSGIEVELLLQK